MTVTDFVILAILNVRLCPCWQNSFYDAANHNNEQGHHNDPGDDKRADLPVCNVIFQRLSALGAY